MFKFIDANFSALIRISVFWLGDRNPYLSSIGFEKEFGSVDIVLIPWKRAPRFKVTNANSRIYIGVSKFRLTSIKR